MAKDVGIVLWLDPGLTTGVASYDFQTGRFHSDQLLFHPLGQYLETICSFFRGGLAVGWERFLMTPGSHAKPDHSIEPIGVTRYLAVKHQCQLLQPVPSSMRELGSDDKLKKLDWYKPGKRHANDAANHVLAWLLREKKLPQNLVEKLCTTD